MESRPSPESSPTESPLDAPPAPTARSHSTEAELNATIGRAILARTERLRPLGRDIPDVTSEMCEAALSEASGRVSEALEILRSAQARFERQTQEALRHREESIADRERALRRTGLKVDLATARLPEAGGTADREPAVVLEELIAADRRLARIESDWKGLQGLLAQIESLRREATDLGIPLSEVSEGAREIRERLTSSSLTPGGLDALAELAAHTLLTLHETVPSNLEEELARHSQTLGRLPAGHAAARPARQLHAEAQQHLEKRRLSEAVQAVRELRRAIETLRETPVRAPPRPAPVPKPAVRELRPPSAAPPPPPVLEVPTLDELLMKARVLAARVRTLPADTEIAHAAALQIVEATELLRAQRLAEADRALTNLMRHLAQPAAGS